MGHMGYAKYLLQTVTELFPGQHDTHSVFLYRSFVQQIINHLEIAQMTPIVIFIADILIGAATVVAVIGPVALFVAILRA